MKFEIGDKVIVKHSNDDGIVKEILNDKMVMVEVKGVKFPAYTDQLDFPYYKWFTEKPVVPVAASAPRKYIDDVRKEKKPVKLDITPGVWLAFFPTFKKDAFDDEVIDALKIYLINATSDHLEFLYKFNTNSKTEFEIQNEILPNSDFYIMNIDFEQVNDTPSFEFEFNLKGKPNNRAEYYEAIYKPKAKQLFKEIERIQTSGDPFYSKQLFELYPDKPSVDKYFEPETTLTKNSSLDKLAAAGFKVISNKRIYGESAPPSVIDLHIEKLTNDYSKMDSGEKLVFQLNALEKYLNRCELNFMKHVTIIHGIGKGRLKEEIHEVLKHRESVKNFVQQHHPWYGNGATEVFFK